MIADIELVSIDRTAEVCSHDGEPAAGAVALYLPDRQPVLTFWCESHLLAFDLEAIQAHLSGSGELVRL